VKYRLILAAKQQRQVTPDPTCFWAIEEMEGTGPKLEARAQREGTLAQLTCRGDLKLGLVSCRDLQLPVLFFSLPQSGSVFHATAG